MAPVVGEGQRRGDGGPDAEGHVDGEGQEEDRVHQRALLDRQVVDPNVPGGQLLMHWISRQVYLGFRA